MSPPFRDGSPHSAGDGSAVVDELLSLERVIIGLARRLEVVERKLSVNA